MANDYLNVYCSHCLMFGGMLHELSLREMKTLNSLRVHECVVDCVLKALSLFAKPEMAILISLGIVPFYEKLGMV